MSGCAGSRVGEERRCRKIECIEGTATKPLGLSLDVGSFRLVGAKPLNDFQCILDILEAFPVCRTMEGECYVIVN